MMTGKENFAYPQNLGVYDLVAGWAQQNPHAIAITAPGRTPLTYQSLYEQINQIIANLNVIGVGRNDRVALALPNGPEMAVAFVAIASCATCAPLNPNYTESEYDFYLSDLNAKALIYQSGSALPVVNAAQTRGIPLVELSPVKQAAAGIFQLTGG